MKERNISNPYQELMGFERPVSHYPSMPLMERAKIFSPFAALTGHGDAIHAMQVMRENKKLLSESELTAINQVIHSLHKGDSVRCTFFHWDPGPDGSGSIAEGCYRKIHGIVRKIDLSLQQISMEENLIIPMDDIFFIEKMNTEHGTK